MMGSLKAHWPEYLMEAAGLATFMISACFFSVLLFHPASEIHQAIADPLLQRAVMGLGMGLTAVAIIYSPWGRQSGAHINPSVTLAFLRLGKVRLPDALFYVASQFVGAVAGVMIAWLLLGQRLADASIRFAATLPGPQGEAIAFVAEVAISALLMFVILWTSSSRFARYTGFAAGVMVALYIAFEAPLSGMSMNPARTFGSAVAAANWSAIWIYFTAPPLGMLLAAALFQRFRVPACAKLYHARDKRCIFCETAPPPPPNAMPKRIVILGGGFGGIYTAQKLEQALGGRCDYELVLLNKENYFVFQPMLAEVVSGTLGVLDMVSPIRRLLPLTNLHVREVEAIDFERRVLTTTPGFQPHRHEVPFDHLVIALGTVTDFRGMRGLHEHALPFKNLEDALRLRNHVIRALEEAAIERHNALLRQQLLTFVVAGGGFSGVEVVAELNDFVRAVVKNYRTLDPKELRIVLVHAQDRILPEVSEGLGLFAQRILRKRGVEIVLNARLAAATGEEAVLADGRRLPTRTLVSTVPSSPHPLVEGLPLPKTKGRIQVNSELEVPGFPGVWSLGDCALVPTPGGGFSPPTAQHATRQAQVLAHNLVASIRGGPRRQFRFQDLGKMGSLGHRSAVAQILGLKISGAMAWGLWRTIYLMKLPGWGRRMKVAASWTFDLFLPPELVLLRFSTAPGMVHEHFEPGEEVFRQGDLGDRVYAIINGTAEVLVGEEGREQSVARLGPGEFFGEIALLEKKCRTATVRCVAPLDTFSLPKREFEMLAAAMPEFKTGLERVRDRHVEPQPPVH
jgi:NADH dehydrogenase